MKQLKVMLIDDEVLVRAGIRCLIDQLKDFAVVAEASGPAETMAKLAESMPNIAVIDTTMGSHNGLDLVRSLKQKFPHLTVVVLSMDASEEFVADALRAGASAYLLKDAAAAELEVALRAVAREEIYLSPAVSTKMIKRFVRTPVFPHNPLQSLTVRQRQILTMIASRKGNKEIAYELNLSEKTVAAHRAKMMKRLGVPDIVGLVLFAVKYGLVKDAA